MTWNGQDSLIDSIVRGSDIIADHFDIFEGSGGTFWLTFFIFSTKNFGTSQFLNLTTVCPEDYFFSVF